MAQYTQRLTQHITHDRASKRRKLRRGESMSDRSDTHTSEIGEMAIMKDPNNEEGNSRQRLNNNNSINGNDEHCIARSAVSDVRQSTARLMAILKKHGLIQRRSSPASIPAPTPASLVSSHELAQEWQWLLRQVQQFQSQWMSLRLSEAASPASTSRQRELPNV